MLIFPCEFSIGGDARPLLFSVKYFPEVDYRNTVKIFEIKNQNNDILIDLKPK